jgi:hypothetical protein
VKRADIETLFRVDVNVVEDPTSPAFNYSFKVGQIVKVDLGAITGVKGKYTFSGLPAWLEGTEAGVLVGMAEKTDIGQYQIEFTVEGAEKVYKSVVHVEVEGVTTPPASGAFQAQVGVMATINLRELATMDGEIQVTHAPSWMTYADGWLYGTPTKKDVGESWVAFFVLGSHTKTGYTFRTSVVE